MARFADLGMPFPLFEAEAQEAAEYRGVDTCFLCQREHVHCFAPSALLVACQHCATENELEVASSATSYHVGGACQHCSSPLPSGKGLVCYSCLRAGRAWITKNTELGMVSREQALAGMTHGVPGLDHPDFELVPRDEVGWVTTPLPPELLTPSDVGLDHRGFVLVPQEERWVAARVPSEQLFELILTPNYPTWQDEEWLFCCRAPMIYIGSWNRATFTERAPDGNGRAFFDEVLQLPQQESDWLWEGVYDSAGIYVFRCPRCGKLRGNFDYA